jgi:hypothetical protein
MVLGLPELLIPLAAAFVLGGAGGLLGERLLPAVPGARD